ncbi:MAG: NTP transferase domain-containing protein [Rhodobacteraceae bacterium]|nr:NTP transferase domain-containing protein [Paracoccaceae bacterium]
MDDLMILIPAAGSSGRMGGRDKLLESVAGEALLRRQARRAAASGAAVLIALPRADGAARAAVLDGVPGLSLVRVIGDEGMAAALRAGARAGEAAQARALMVLLPDMPDIETGDLRALWRAFQQAPDTCLRATAADGAPGHPVLFPARLFEQLAGLSGDLGGRTILAREPVRTLPLAGMRAVTDLDTMADWAAWRARTGL